MPKRKPKNTWVLIVSAVGALLLVGIIVFLDELNAPIDGVIRAGALLGYLAAFLTSLSSNYMRELTRFFGRSFIKVHHLVAATALVAMAVHAVAVAWRAGSPNVFLPVFSSLRSFLSLGGRPAFWLFAVTSVTALLRSSLRKQWRTLHWLNYLAFLLGTVHAQLIGTSFQNIVVRLVSIAMALALTVLFIYKRTK